MIMRAKVLAAMATVAVVTTAGVTAAPAVWAAERSNACTNLDGLLTDAEVESLTMGDDPGFIEGEVLTFSFTPVAGDVTLIEMQMLNDLSDPSTPFTTVASTTSVPGTITYSIPARLAAPAYVSIRVVVTGGVAALTTACSPAPGPVPAPAWVQAYGRGEAAPCDAGWNASWQEWAVPVTGGWVCTRSVPSLG